MTQAAELAGYASSLPSFRNRIINGDMRIDQRNAGGSVSASVNTPTYTVDRWLVYSLGAGSSVQQVAGPNTTDKALQVSPSSGNTYQGVIQRIESKNCIDLIGQTVNVSGKIYIDNASGTSCSVSILAATSTDSNYATSQGSFSVSLTSGSYVTFSGNIALTSAVANGFELYIAFSSASGKIIKITNVQLEVGTVATPFEHRPIGTELALCQRYFCWNGGTDDTSFFNINADNIAGSYNFPVQMRATPTIKPYNGTTANQVLLIGGSAVTANSIIGISKLGFCLINNTNIGTGVGGATFNVWANAEL